MRDRLFAILNFALAILLYPTALALLIWIGWTGRSIIWALAVIIAVLLIDRSWWQILNYWLQRWTGSGRS